MSAGSSAVVKFAAITALVMALLIGPAEGQTIDEWCKPGGDALCTAKTTTDFVYLPRTCTLGVSENTLESEAFELAWNETQGNAPGCPANTIQPLGWADGHMTPADFAIYCPGYGNGPFPTTSYDVEVDNYARYLKTKYIAPACTTEQQTLGLVQRTRSLVCPEGIDGNGGSYCYRSDTAQDVGKNLGDQCKTGQCFLGNPINVGVGNKYQEEFDFAATGPNPLAFRRYYNSLAGLDDSNNGLYRFGNSGPNSVRASLNGDNSATAAVATDAIGVSWRHSYQAAIAVHETQDIRSAFIYRPEGRVYAYREHGAAWHTDADVNFTLIELQTAGATTGWELTTDEDALEVYSAEGRLQTITDREGFTTTLAYDGIGRLTTVTDHFGKQIAIGYAASPDPGQDWWENSAVENRITTVTDPAGGVYSYGYDSLGNLVSMTHPDTTVRHYVYENASFPYALTGIVDRNGDRYATFGYDADGRANLSYHGPAANPSERVDISYTTIGVNAPIYRITDAQVTYAAGTSQQLVQDIDIAAKVGVAKTTGITKLGSSSSKTYDTNGNLERSTDYGGEVTYRAYDARNLVTTLTEAEGATEERTTTMQWHAGYRLPTKVTRPSVAGTGYDQETEYTYVTGTPLVASITVRGHRPDGAAIQRTTAFTYNADNQLETIDGPRTGVSDVTTISYYSCTTGYECGQIASVTNPLGHVTTFDTYDAFGRVLQSTDPNGLQTHYVYSSAGELTSVTQVPVSGTNRQTTMAYDSAGQLTSVTRPDGQVLTFTYDDAHYLTTITDNLGNRIEYDYDARGNRTDEDTYDPGSSLKRAVDSVYDVFNHLDTVSSGGSLTDYAIDIEGNLTSTVDPNSAMTTHSYDALDRLTQTVDALLGVTSYAYDVHDNTAVVTAANGAKTVYSYDDLGNLLEEISPDRGTTTYTYDVAGNLATKTDARGKLTSYTYDALNRLTLTTLDGGGTIAYEYDVGANAKGRLNKITDATGNTSWSFDSFGAVTQKTQTIGSVALSTSYAYDSAGRMTSMTLPSGKVVGYGYNTYLPTSVTVDGATVLSAASYDPFGPVNGWTWGNGAAHSKSFDVRGLLTSHTLAGSTRTLGYDAAGQLTSLNDPRHTDTFGYDLLGRLDDYTHTGLAPLPASQAFEYDENGNRTRLTENGTAYDYTVEASNPLLVLAPVGSPDTTITQSVTVPATQFQWTITMPSVPGEYEFRLFDAAGVTKLATSSPVRVQAVPETQTPEITLSTIQVEGGAYVTATLTGGPGNPSDWLSISALGSSDYSYLTYVYVGSGQTSKVWTRWVAYAPGAYEYRLYENNGYNVLARSEPLSIYAAPPACGTPPCVDALAAAVRPGATASASVEVTEFSNTNRLLNTAGPVAKTYSHDAAGNVIGDGIHIYGYDDRGRLVSVDATAATYQHNGQGQRVKKDNGSVTLFAYDEGGQLLGEYDSSGNAIREHVWFEGAPVAVISAAGTYYVHTDQLGTPRAITDGATVIWRWESDAFGSTPAQEDPDGDTNLFTYNLRFPGQYYDSETGLHYNYFRTYDPGVGRYLRSDPIGLDGGMNTYDYAGSNPLTFKDPLGLRKLTEAEKEFLQHYFGNCLPDLDKIRLRGKPGWRAMNPNKRLILMPNRSFGGEKPKNELALDDFYYASLFAHEAFHIVQRLQGRSVTINSTVNHLKSGDPYDYGDLDQMTADELFDLFSTTKSVERQAKIVQDFIEADLHAIKSPMLEPRIQRRRKFDKIAEAIRNCDDCAEGSE